MALDDARKDALAGAEMSAFGTQTGAVKVFTKEDGVYGGQSYTIYRDSEDADGPAKVAAVHKGVKTIKDKGIAIPTGLRVYCTKEYAAQNRAFSRGVGWNEVAWVILGPAALQGGRPDALSALQINGFDKPTVTCIHEIGHILHERSAGNAYWEINSVLTGKATHSNEVSGYAGQNKKEFVAEVFAGLILGKTYSNECMQEYQQLSGPNVP